MATCALDDVDIAGRLPLALEITAVVLSTHPKLDLDKLADQPDSEHGRLGVLCPGDGSPPDESFIQVTLDLAYRGLSETTARVFRLLPVSPGPDLSTDAIAALADCPVGQAGEVLVDLTRACLIEPTSGNAGRWRMNDLVRRYAQQLSAARAEADHRELSRDRLFDFYLTMSASADDHLRRLPGTWSPREFADRDQALAWLDAERKNLIAAVQVAADTGRHHVAVSLPLLLAQYFAYRRDFADLRAMTLVSLATARRLGDRDAEGDALTNLGSALLETGQYPEATAAHQDAAAIFRETGDRRGEGAALNNLGLGLIAMGQATEAVTVHRDAATIFKETGDRRREDKALNNMREAMRKAGR
ncbi:MAG TPA: tetratricopeptide repeat protein [Streptosporangiaceae bacterium]|nr:tetratricopeptide repeat protein [Streptosporangiaceae bacterium]